MTRPIRDLPASVRQRLANVATAERRPAAEVLQYYAMERFLYRLGTSSYRDSFLLKGALMLVAWRAPATRPTMDIDLLGHGHNHTTELERIVRFCASCSATAFASPTASAAGWARRASRSAAKCSTGSRPS